MTRLGRQDDPKKPLPLSAARYELVFLNFYADWCRFSQLLAPVFEEAAAKATQLYPVSRHYPIHRPC